MSTDDSSPKKVLVAVVASLLTLLVVGPISFFAGRVVRWFDAIPMLEIQHVEVDKRFPVEPSVVVKNPSTEPVFVWKAEYKVQEVVPNAYGKDPMYGVGITGINSDKIVFTPRNSSENELVATLRYVVPPSELNEFVVSISSSSSDIENTKYSGTLIIWYGNPRDGRKLEIPDFDLAVFP